MRVSWRVSEKGIGGFYMGGCSTGVGVRVWTECA